MEQVKRALAAALLALLIACEPSGPSPAAGPTRAPAADSGAPELPAVEPSPPSVEEFTIQAATACSTAVSELEATPLRGDPLAEYARRRDVRAARRHYSAAAGAWDAAASRLFEFGLPEAATGRRLVSALDVVAMRFRQVAQALVVGDDADTQLFLGAADQALAEADAAARDLGLGPLLECGQTSPRPGGHRLVVANAVDFTFQVGQVAPGPTRIVLRNRGTEDHQVFVVPLLEAGTLHEAVAADRRGRRIAPFLAGAGSTSPVARPGERVVVDVDLQPGPYGFLCFVASPDGTPHAYKGMAREVMVPG